MKDFLNKKWVHWTVVLLVFACTGTTTARLDTWLTELLGYEKYHWVWWLLLVALLPVYNVLLLAFGFVFGKFAYFREKQKKMWRRMFGWAMKKEKKNEDA